MNMNKPWKVVLVFVGVFLAGAICGGPLAMRFFRPGRPEERAASRPQILQRLVDDLKLSEEQKAKIQPIVQRTLQETQRLRRENVKAIAAVMEQMHGEVAAELTPEQRVKQDEMRKRFRERAERVRSEFRDHDRPPPPSGDAEPGRN